MIKTNSLSSANAQNISQVNKSSHISSMIEIKSSNDFEELLSQLSSQMSLNKSSTSENNKDTQLPLASDKASLKDLNTKLISDILQYFQDRNMDYQSSKSLAQSDIQASSLKQETKLKHLLSKLSKIANKNGEIPTDKPVENNDTKDTQLPLASDKASLKDLNNKLISDILQYFQDRNTEYQSNKPFTQNASKDLNKDKISEQCNNSSAQLLSLINTIISDRPDINITPVKMNFLNAAINAQNAKINDQNKDTENKISSQQHLSGNNPSNQKNTIQDASAFNIESQTPQDNNQSKTDNISTNAILNTILKSLLDSPKTSSQVIANESSQNKYVQDSQINSLNYESKNQASAQLNLDTNTNYGSQVQNNNTNFTNSQYNQTIQDVVLSYKLNDNKPNVQKTNIDNTNQQQFQNVSNKISIDPKSLQAIDQNTTQQATALLKIVQEGQEAQTTVQDKTKTDLIDAANKNQPQETFNLQTNNLLSSPQAKENSSLSSNMQAIIDKIMQMKNLNPPVIRTVTISVNPPSLGNIDLQVSIDSKKNLTATIDVQSQDLFNVLNKNLDSLKDTLQNQGFNISQISLNIKNDSQQSFYQGNQNQQSSNNNFLNFNQGSNNSHSHQQGTFSQTFNRNEQNNKQTSYSIDAKQMISNKARINNSLIDINA